MAPGRSLYALLLLSSWASQRPFSSPSRTVGDGTGFLREERTGEMSFSMNKRWPDFWAVDARMLQLNLICSWKGTQVSKAAAEMTGRYKEMWPHPNGSPSSSGPHSLCLLWRLPALLEGSLSDPPPYPCSTSGHGLICRCRLHRLHLPPAFDRAANVQQMQMPRARWNQFKG